MFARFDENPAMNLQDIKETKRYGRTDTRTDARTDNMKTVYPLQTKFAGGIINVLLKDDNVVTTVRLEPVAPRSPVKHTTTEPLRSLYTDFDKSE